MLHPWTIPSSTPWVLPRVLMADQTARFFLCARCHEQVLVCRRCDRGQRYCARACSSTSRQTLQRQAAGRYQHSRTGRFKHALRTRRWRARQVEQAKIVTHQGSHCPPCDALLPAAQPCAVAAQPCTTTTTTTIAATATADVLPNAWRCHWCCTPSPVLVRQGFLRHGRIPRHGHSP